MSFRPYTPGDKDRLLEIFHSNYPKYFDKNDLADLINFLDNQADEHFEVVLQGSRIIGCGGYYVNHETKTFGIAWVMFMRDSLGFKHFLIAANGFFDHLLSNLRKEPPNYDIMVNTTQLLEKMLGRYGFRTEKMVKDGFGPGLDHYTMRRPA